MDTSTEREISPLRRREDENGETALRPRNFVEYVGQMKVRERVEVAVRAARMRGEPLDHVLLSGPPGLGKTTLASIIAEELGVTLHTTSGPAIDKKGDLAGLLTQLEAGDVLFIDEIHRLKPRSRRTSIPRWRTSTSTWSWARGLARTACGSP